MAGRPPRQKAKNDACQQLCYQLRGEKKEIYVIQYEPKSVITGPTVLLSDQYPFVVVQTPFWGDMTIHQSQ